MPPPVLAVKLSAGYAKQTVLNDVEFRLHEGERLGLIGTSGAGKSTLLLALLGLLPWRGGWAKGEVLVNGKNLLEMPEREARKLRGSVMALVPQSPLTALNSALSLRAHFVEAWRAHSMPPRALEERLNPILGRVNLPTDMSFLKRKPTQISVGQAQRVTIALALIHRPLILIADEPTSSLDPITQAEVTALLRELSEEQGTALLFISHDLLSVIQLTERIALLHDGSIAEELSVRHLNRDAKHPAMRALLRTLPAPADVLLRYVQSSRGVQRSDNNPSKVHLPAETNNWGAMVGEVIPK